MEKLFEKTNFDVLKVADFQSVRSIMMYMTRMKNTGNAKEVMKKLTWKALKL